jgi:hypothetical protein
MTDITMKTTTTLYSCLAALGLTFALGTQPALAFVNVAVQPTNQVILTGSNAVFTALATPTAGETITSYSWQTSTNVSGPYIPVLGATTSTCTLTNVQTTGTNYCFARVTYNSGADIGLVSVSPAATLVVLDQARIVTQPQGGLIRPTGWSNVTFSVTAAGSPPLIYQWRLNGVSLQNGTHITGATSANLAVTNLTPGDSGSYVVVVSNSNSSATSQVATLGVFNPAGISVPLPGTNYVILGSNAVISVTTTGTPPLSFQWRQDGTNLVNGGRISGATSNALTIAATITNDASSYSVIITNPVSGPLTSSVTTLTVLVPATFTSATNLTWRQGLLLNFTNTATGTLPITFGATGLPAGLSIEPTNGVISGIPLVTGDTNIALYATNCFYPGNGGITSTGQLALTLTTGVPGITSALLVNGKQGNNFNYTIVASNNPTSFSASALPAGLIFDPTSGVISGPPIVSGTFPIIIGAMNQFGGDSQVLTITLASAVPVITSSLTALWQENLSGFRYTIRASNSPTSFGAANLPLGLTLNTTNGLISGTPLSGGTYTFPIWAINAWGTASANLVLTVNYATPGGLAIANVTTTWSKPYLLDFAFSLRDGPDPLVRPTSRFQVVAMENWVPLQPDSPPILQSASAKQMKTFLALDYTFSMLVSPGAIDAMQAAAELLVNQEPPHAMFGIVEFNADYMVPQFVTNRLTAANNYFITDKTLLSQTIEGIQTNYVRGNYAASRCWDALWLALQQYGPNNSDEARYLVAMTDGNDESSSIVPTSPVPYTPLNAVTNIINLANALHVTIYCVGYGNNVNTTALQLLTSQTGGRYYLAATTTDLATQFQRILKELDGLYVLRWATSQRGDIPNYPTDGFQPSFQISYGNLSGSWNTAIVMTNLTNVDQSVVPYVTNVVPTNFVMYPFNPPDWTNDVKLGSLRLVSDAELGPQTIRLRATYVPRYVRAMRVNYRPNYPCTASLNSTNVNEMLSGWTMTETNDATGLRTLTITSSDTNNYFTSIPYADFGDLLSFNFQYPDALTSTQAFSVFNIDNSIYTNVQPSGIRFTNVGFTNFVKLYPTAPPHGTPIPWMLANGLSIANPAATELQIATNGLPVWQTYLAGLNPRDPNSRFAVWSVFTPGQTPQINFSTVMGRTYRVDCATTLDSWSVLRDNIPGTGSTILFIDNRTLSGVNAQYYRVSVY